MRQHQLRVLALIAALASSALLNPPHTALACTAEYPPRFFESHVIKVPSLPDGIEIYTTPKEISKALDNPDITRFTFEENEDLRGNPDWVNLGLLAVTNLSDKSVYVLANKDEVWATPEAHIVMIVPAGFMPMYEVKPGEGLEFEAWNGIAVGAISPSDQQLSGTNPILVNDTHINLYYDKQIIDIPVTFTYTYNPDYAATAAAIDKYMDECQRLMYGQPRPILNLNALIGFLFPATTRANPGTLILILTSVVCVFGVTTVGAATWLWLSRRGRRRTGE